MYWKKKHRNLFVLFVSPATEHLDIMILFLPKPSHQTRSILGRSNQYYNHCVICTYEKNFVCNIALRLSWRRTSMTCANWLSVKANKIIQWISIFHDNNLARTTASVLEPATRFFVNSRGPCQFIRLKLKFSQQLPLTRIGNLIELSRFASTNISLWR